MQKSFKKTSGSIGTQESLDRSASEARKIRDIMINLILCSVSSRPRADFVRTNQRICLHMCHKPVIFRNSAMALDGSALPPKNVSNRSVSLCEFF